MNADKELAKLLAARSVFCPSCSVSADMRRMLWVEDSQGIVFGSIRCHRCVDSKPFPIHPAANERWHGWNQVWVKRLNKTNDPAEIARVQREQEEHDAKEIDRTIKLRLSDPYLFLPNSWEERQVDIVLSTGSRRIGRFQGRASVQVPAAKRAAQAFARIKGGYVTVVDAASTGTLHETVFA